jgi:maltose-binding protein MalE
MRAGLLPGFLAVNGFYVARHGRNEIVASDLVPDYLTRLDVTEAFGRMPHVVPLELSDEADLAIAEFHAVCATAWPMPTFSWMPQVWALLSEQQRS